MPSHAMSARHASTSSATSRGAWYWSSIATAVGGIAAVAVVGAFGASANSGAQTPTVAAAGVPGAGSVAAGTASDDAVDLPPAIAIPVAAVADRSPAKRPVDTLELRLPRVTLVVGRPTAYDNSGVLGGGRRIAVPVTAVGRVSGPVPLLQLACGNSPFPGNFYLDSTVLPGSTLGAGVTVEGSIILGLPRGADKGVCSNARVLISDRGVGVGQIRVDPDVFR